MTNGPEATRVIIIDSDVAHVSWLNTVTANLSQGARLAGRASAMSDFHGRPSGGLAREVDLRNLIREGRGRPHPDSGGRGLVACWRDAWPWVALSSGTPSGMHEGMRGGMRGGKRGAR